MVPTLRQRLISTVVLAAVAALAATAAAQERFTPHHVAKLRSVTSAAIAPDGQHAAYVLTVPRVPFEEEDGPNWDELHVSALDGTTRPFVTGSVNVGNLKWLPDGARERSQPRLDAVRETRPRRPATLGEVSAMDRDAPSNDNPNWLCLTPLTDADGRALSIEERLRHAGKIVVEQNVRAFDVVEAQLEDIPELTPAMRLEALRKVGDILAKNTEATLTRIAAQLVADHAWMDRHWTS